MRFVELLLYGCNKLYIGCDIMWVFVEESVIFVFCILFCCFII